jgi:hypothetical protein
MDVVQAIHALYEKYDLPKMLGFVPDRLEITVTRHPDQQFTLRYTERFLYLPDYALETARDNAIQLLHQLHVPIETLQPVDKGVQLQLTSDARLIWHLILELLMQLHQPAATVRAQLDTFYQQYHLFRALLDTQWHWDDTIAQTYAHVTTTLDTVMQEHPTFYEELMTILKNATRTASHSEKAGTSD